MGIKIPVSLHRVVKTRMVKNCIRLLHNSNNQLLLFRSEIPNEAISYYQNLLSATDPNVLSIHGPTPHRSLYKQNHVHLLSLSNGKAPGPDAIQQNFIKLYEV